MRKLPIRAILALSVSTSLAAAQEIHHDVSPYYLQLGLAGVSTDSVEPASNISADFDTGLGFSLLAGRELGKLGPFGVSLEGELYYSFMNLDKGDTPQFLGAGGAVRARGARSLSMIANLMLDYPLYKDTSCYIAAGFGYAPSIEFDTLDTGNLNQDETDSVIAQAKLGMKWRLGGRSDFLMGYRYLRSEGLDVTSTLTGSSNVTLEQHALEFTLRWGI